MILNFGDALELLKKNKKMARVGWNEKGRRVQIKRSSKMHMSYFSVEYPSKNNIEAREWIPEPVDLLANDWFEVDSTKP